jgi:hypothetical protein
MHEALEFSNAAFSHAVFSHVNAALNCTQLGARGCIATTGEALALKRHAERRSRPDLDSAARRA